jgi:hypothetical protein
MATPICSICTHPEHAAIDEALSTGGALIPTSARFGVSKSALHRHKVGCLAPKIAAVAKVMQSTKEAKAPVTRAKQIATGAAPTVEDVLSLSGLLERISRSLDRLENGAISASTDNLHAAHAGLAAQLHRGIEAVGKLRGYYSDAPQRSEQDRFSITINLDQPGTPSGSRIIDGSAVRVPEATPALPHIPSKDFGVHFDIGDSLDAALSDAEALTED